MDSIPVFTAGLIFSRLRHLSVVIRHPLGQMQRTPGMSRALSSAGTQIRTGVKTKTSLQEDVLVVKREIWVI